MALLLRYSKALGLSFVVASTAVLSGCSKEEPIKPVKRSSSYTAPENNIPQAPPPEPSLEYSDIGSLQIEDLGTSNPKDDIFFLNGESVIAPYDTTGKYENPIVYSNGELAILIRSGEIDFKNSRTLRHTDLVYNQDSLAYEMGVTNWDIAIYERALSALRGEAVADLPDEPDGIGVSLSFELKDDAQTGEAYIKLTRPKWHRESRFMPDRVDESMLKERLVWEQERLVVLNAAKADLDFAVEFGLEALKEKKAVGHVNALVDQDGVNDLPQTNPEVDRPAHSPDLPHP